MTTLFFILAYISLGGAVSIMAIDEEVVEAYPWSFPLAILFWPFVVLAAIYHFWVMVGRYARCLVGLCDCKKEEGCGTCDS